MANLPFGLLKQDSSPISDDRSLLLSFPQVFSDGSLYLTDVQLSFTGNYTCQAETNSAVKQTHILHVVGKSALVCPVSRPSNTTINIYFNLDAMMVKWPQSFT